MASTPRASNAYTRHRSERHNSPLPIKANTTERKVPVCVVEPEGRYGAYPGDMSGSLASGQMVGLGR